MIPRLPTRARVLRLAACLLAASTPLASTPLAAQGDTSADSAPHVAVLTPRDVIVTGALAAGTFALLPFDQRIAHWMQQPSRQSNDALRNGAAFFRNLGSPGTIVIGGATYLAGRLDDSPRVEELGVRTLESIAAGSAVGYVIKGLAGRDHTRSATRFRMIFMPGAAFTTIATRRFHRGTASPPSRRRPR